MPVLKSFAFASNRGGVGKTTTVVQLAASYAFSHTEVNVLLVDFSIHGDATSLMLGGTQAPDTFIKGIHTLGQQRAAAVAKNEPQRTAAGLVQAALSHAATVPALAESMSRMTLRGFARGIFGGGGKPAASPKKLDFKDYCVNVTETTKEDAPANLFITPSHISSEDEISALELALLDPDASCGCKSSAWEQAIEPMRKAMTDTSGDWVLFFDTDAELVERAPSRLAMTVADKAVMMLSSDWRAYIRLLADARNGLFHFLSIMQKRGEPFARICMMLMNNVEKRTTDPIDFKDCVFETPEGKKVSVVMVPVPFTPSKDVLFEMSTISEHVFDNQVKLKEYHPLWSQEIMSTFRPFCRKYFDALPKYTGAIDLVTSGTGIPIASLVHTRAYEIESGITGVGKHKQEKLDNAALKFHKAVLNDVVNKLHEAYDLSPEA
jgi:hypothetical protein